MFTLLKSERLVDAVQTQLIDVSDNSCGHVRTMLLVYGTSTKMMECRKCRDVVMRGERGGGGSKAQPRRLMAMRNSSLVNWSCSNVQHNGVGA